jgi:hypothetical protein
VFYSAKKSTEAKTGKTRVQKQIPLQNRKIPNFAKTKQRAKIQSNKFECFLIGNPFFF